MENFSSFIFHQYLLFDALYCSILACKGCMLRLIMIGDAHSSFSSVLKTNQQCTRSFRYMVIFSSLILSFSTISEFIQVILLKDCPNLGVSKDIVNVRPGYMRNYLVCHRQQWNVSLDQYPRGIAVYDVELNRIKYNIPKDQQVVQKKKSKH